MPARSLTVTSPSSTGANQSRVAEPLVMTFEMLLDPAGAPAWNGARHYVELRGFQRQVAIANDNVKSQQETLELTRAKFNAGLTSDLDVARWDAALDTPPRGLAQHEQNDQNDRRDDRPADLQGGIPMRVGGTPSLSVTVLHEEENQRHSRASARLG